MIITRENSNHACAVGLSRDIPPCHKPIRSLHRVIPDATSNNLGWVGLQAIRYRDLATNEIHIPALAQHLLVLHTKPPAEVNFRCGGVKREIAAPVGSITVVPVGSVVECRWRGTKDRFHIYLDPKFDAFIAPELRATMLAVDAELRAGGLGGPLIIESLATILAVRLIRHVFGRRRLTTDGVFSQRKLKTIVDYIMANLNGSPTLDQMAALARLSPYHFARQFKAATGFSPSHLGNFGSPEESPKTKSEQVLPTHYVAIYVAYSSSRCDMAPSIKKSNTEAVFVSHSHSSNVCPSVLKLTARPTRD